MKQILNLLLVTAFFVIQGCNSGAQSANECPPEGRERPTSQRLLNQREKDLNMQKNRNPTVPPGDEQPGYWDLAKIINAPRHDDEDDFKEGTYVYTEGYIIKAEEQGSESCNCYEADRSSKTGDVHIYFGISPDAEENECIVIEITPAYKKIHPNYELLLATGNKVRVYGYLLYDYVHEKNAVNTCKTYGKNTWRKNCWEIHPVVRME